MLLLMKQPRKRSKLVIGLMSGTSADGIDAVLVRISEEKGRLSARLIHWVHRPFKPSLRGRVLKASLEGTVAEICELNFLLGEKFAEATLALLRAAGVEPREVFGIGSHGQTVHHLPSGSPPSTLQIGEESVIAERTGITTVGDFRVRDVAAGGQGAPLVPYAEWALFRNPVQPRVFQNIGGIANLTFLPANARLDQVVAFDTGPGNMVIDGVISRLTRGKMGMDRNGRWAARGEASNALLAWLMEHPFLARRPPRTTGREDFGSSFVEGVLNRAELLRLTPDSIVASVTEFTAASIETAYRKFVFPKIGTKHRGGLEVILGGGGAKNPVLRRRLEARLPEVIFRTHEDFGIPNEAKEALAFAVLAYETLLGRPSNVPSATGASRPAILGKIVPGR
jgi:anhydro-N-acetylmuramic acid kinase